MAGVLGKRKFRAKPRARKRPRIVGGRMRRIVPRSVRPPGMTLKRRFFLQSWAFSGAAVNDFWRYYGFNLNQLPNVTDFTNLFDEYRINGIRLSFYPRYSDYQAGTTAAPQPSRIDMVQVIDPMTTITVAGSFGSTVLNGLMEDSNARIRDLSRPRHIYFKPKVLVANGQWRFSPWLRSDQVSADHRGVHVFLKDANFVGATGPIIDVFVTFYFSLRNLK